MKELLKSKLTIMFISIMLVNMYIIKNVFPEIEMSFKGVTVEWLTHSTQMLVLFSVDCFFMIKFLKKFKWLASHMWFPSFMVNWGWQDKALKFMGVVCLVFFGYMINHLLYFIFLKASVEGVNCKLFLEMANVFIKYACYSIIYYTGKMIKGGCVYYMSLKQEMGYGVGSWHYMIKVSKSTDIISECVFQCLNFQTVYENEAEDESFLLSKDSESTSDWHDFCEDVSFSFSWGLKKWKMQADALHPNSMMDFDWCTMWDDLGSEEIMSKEMSNSKGKINFNFNFSVIKITSSGSFMG